MMVPGTGEASLSEPDPMQDVARLRDMYLDLLKKALINLLYPEMELSCLFAVHCAGQNQPISPEVLMNPGGHLSDQLRELVRCRREGRRTEPHFSHSMIGLERLNNIQSCAERIFEEGIPGDFVETGVWRGGAVIFMRAVLKAFNEEQRLVWAADSFRGLPAPKMAEDAGYDFHTIRTLSISRETVMNNFRTYDLLDDGVKFIEGWFDETLPHAPIEKIALLRLDGDLYKSTMDAIESLYDRVSIGGYIIVDDFGDLEPCRRAINDFRERRGISEPIVPIDWTGVYWRKGGL
jgi:hypothetical protein